MLVQKQAVPHSPLLSGGGRGRWLVSLAIGPLVIYSSDMALGIAIGVTVGTAMGTVLDNLAIGVAIGIAIGAGLGYAVQRWR